mmetsp:Transcript_13540/g.34059  ORF Transcript_13540/g.34059 Transcript_13540/m.34059 type:complete len:214 (+) Transcript_13540:287-928(+)
MPPRRGRPRRGQTARLPLAPSRPSRCGPGGGTPPPWSPRPPTRVPPIAPPPNWRGRTESWARRCPPATRPPTCARSATARAAPTRSSRRGARPSASAARACRSGRRWCGTWLPMTPRRPSARTWSAMGRRPSRPPRAVGRGMAKSSRSGSRARTRSRWTGRLWRRCAWTRWWWSCSRRGTPRSSCAPSTSLSRRAPWTPSAACGGASTGWSTA